MLPTDIDKVLNLIAAAQDALGEASYAIAHLSDPQPKLIPVPYRSQHDKDAGISNLDCGGACVAMLLEWRGQNIAVDDVTRIAGLDSTNANELRQAGNHWGLALTLRLDISPAEIEDLIDDGVPMIALVDYAKFGTYRQDLGYNGLHWVIVLGYDAQSFYINDPDYWGEHRLDGWKRAIPRDLFIAAQVTLPGARNRQVLLA